jgi:hypothetical protein
MKNLILCYALLLSLPLAAQNAIDYPTASLILQLPQGSGKNGTAVAYNPEKRIYYTAFAGNPEFPIHSFSADGTLLDESRIGNDIRGLWWNPKSETLEGNCYGDLGWVQIGLDENDMPGRGNRTLVAGPVQPMKQAVGAFDPRRKEVLFLQEDARVLGFRLKDGKPAKTEITLELPQEANRHNKTTLIYTGKKNRELGILDVGLELVYLFGLKDGKLSETITLPKGSVKDYQFNFSFANDHIFLFDPEERRWTGYRIF